MSRDATVKRFAESSRELGSFYVPAFEVHVDDERVPDGIVRDVMEVRYQDSVENIDECELTINNWDPENQSFKYIGAPGSGDSPFEPGRKVTLKMGYRGHLQTMLVGQITTLAAAFPEAGRPTLTVGTKNELHGISTEPHTWRFTNKKDSAIARWIGSHPIRRGRPGIDLTVRAPNEDNETAEDVEMHNEPDIVFLLRRARIRGYTVALRRDGDDRYLYFGPPDHGQQAPADRAPPQQVLHELAWGSGLLSFQPELTTANQVSQVTVRGFDRDSGRPIEHTATLDNLRPRLNADQHDVARAVEGRREVIHLPVRSRREARERAERILQNNNRGMIIGNGETVGLPTLRSGEHIRLTNLGPRFSGLYFVLETTHSIGDGGYRTSFKARREEEVQQEEQSSAAGGQT